MARLLTDAGAEYPFSDDSSAGSLALDFATVLDRAGDADYWLLKTYGTDVTLRDLKADYELNGRMKAWQTGEVYAANTAACMMYEEFPFHPERLLADYMRIFHRTLTDSLPEARVSVAWQRGYTCRRGVARTDGRGCEPGGMARDRDREPSAYGADGTVCRSGAVGGGIAVADGV